MLHIYVKGRGGLRPFLTSGQVSHTITLSTDEIKSHGLCAGLIVECTWDRVLREWKLCQVRTEKRFPNALDVALSNWQLICTPVRLAWLEKEQMEEDEMSTLGKRVRAVDKDHAYYEKNRVGTDDYTRKQRSFHNWIKMHILEDVLKQSNVSSPVILDISIGRGGDLSKYQRVHSLHQNISKLIGLDINASNLSMAWERYLDMSSDETIFQTYMMCIDCTSTKEEVWKSASPVYGVDGPREIHRLLFEQHLVNLVVVHFTMHFFWDRRETMLKFVENVGKWLQPGGYVIISGFDGMEIYQYFKEHPHKDSIEVMASSTDLIWQIRRNYDIKRKFSESDPFGFEIELFQHSIHRSNIFQEYLIHSPTLLSLMSTIGCLPVSSMSSPFLPLATKWHPSFDRRSFMSSKTTSTTQDLLWKTFSGWNRLWVFQRSSNRVSQHDHVHKEERTLEIRQVPLSTISRSKLPVRNIHFGAVSKGHA